MKERHTFLRLASRSGRLFPLREKRLRAVSRPPEHAPASLGEHRRPGAAATAARAETDG